MSERIKSGTPVMVSDIGEIDHVEPADVALFLYIGTNIKGRHVCEQIGTGTICQWKYVAKAPEKQTKHYTFETFPRGIVYVRRTSIPLLDELVISVSVDGVSLSNNEELSFLSISSQFEISTDLCKTWRPCVDDSYSKCA